MPQNFKLPVKARQCYERCGCPLQFSSRYGTRSWKCSPIL